MKKIGRLILSLSFLMLLCLLIGFKPNVIAAEYGLGDIPLDKITYEKYLKAIPLREPFDQIPPNYDARNYGLVTPAKDQGACGSCWAFASIGAMESHLLKKYSLGPADLSEQQQVSCNLSMSGCSGGNLTATQYWETTGPIQEACFPYTANDSTPCSYSCEELTYRVVDWYTVPQSESGFKNSLYDDGPSYWRFDVYSDFYTYWNSGNPGDVYFQTSGGFSGGHAVLLIGWDDNKGAYLAKNSWGAQDGPNGDGTFWIAYSGHAHDLRFQMSNFQLSAITDVSVLLSPKNTNIPRGGTLGFWVAATNNTESIHCVEFWTNITLPNYATYPESGKLLDYPNVCLSPFSTKKAYFTHGIPVHAQQGSYTYNAFLGQYPGVLSEDHYDFMVFSPIQNNSKTESPQ